MLSFHNKTIARYLATHAVRALLKLNISANLLAILNFVKIYYRRFLAISVVFANRKSHVSIFYLSIYFQIFQNRSFLSIACFEINSTRFSHMDNLSEFMSEFDVDQQTQNRNENSIFNEHEKFQIFFFFSIQSDFFTLNFNVNLRRRSEKTKMQKMKQSNKSRRHSRESLNVYLSDTFSKNVNQKNIVNFIRRKQNQFAESYNEFFDYFMNKFEEFDDRLNQFDNKLDAFFVTINNKFETLKNKMTRNIAIVMKIEFADFKKNFKKKLKIEFVSKNSVSQKTIILSIAKNVSVNKSVLHSKSKISHDSFEFHVQNSFIKQNVRNENYKFIFDQISHMKQRSEMIFSFESNFNQNLNIFSYFQFTFGAFNKQLRLFDNDLSNNDYENRRDRSMNRFEYIKNQNQSRDRHDVSILEVIVTTKSNQFKISDFDFFYFEYFKNQNSIDYVIEKKKSFISTFTCLLKLYVDLLRTRTFLNIYIFVWKMQLRFDTSFWVSSNVTILCFRLKFFASLLLLVTKIIQRTRMLSFRLSNTSFVTLKNDVNLTSMWTF